MHRIKFKNPLRVKNADIGCLPDDSVELTTVYLLSEIPKATMLGSVM